MRRLRAGRADRHGSTRTFSTLLARSSPKAVVGNITAPTLLVQGERDTLFPLSQADANARAIAANGATVAMTWYNGGHDGGSPDAATEDRITAVVPVLPGRHRPGAVERVPVHRGRPDQRHRPRPQPDPARSPPTPGWRPGPSTNRTAVPLTGDPQFVVNPPGGSPASISTLPGAVRSRLHRAVHLRRRAARPDRPVRLGAVRRR